MFKLKNKNTVTYLISLIIQTPVTCFTNNKVTTNSIYISSLKESFFNTISKLSELNSLFSVDLVGISSLNKYNAHTNSILYSYQWDLYINVSNSLDPSLTLSKSFYNRVWSEREICEMFGKKYTNLMDTRPLLLNYGYKLNVMSKQTPLQPNFEYRTNWHSRSVEKLNNQNIEL
jgi:NADH:ubiquinone oxidoreductase subunit C